MNISPATRAPRPSRRRTPRRSSIGGTRAQSNWSRRVASSPTKDQRTGGTATDGRTDGHQPRDDRRHCCRPVGTPGGPPTHFAYLSRSRRKKDNPGFDLRASPVPFRSARNFPRRPEHNSCGVEKWGISGGDNYDSTPLDIRLRRFDCRSIAIRAMLLPCYCHAIRRRTTVERPSSRVG